MTLVPELNERLRQALASGAAGDTDNTIALLRQAMAEEPASPLPHFLLGAEYAQTGRIDEALRAYAAATVLAPGFHIARYQMGLLQMTSGNVALALVTWQPLFGLAPDQPLRAFVHGFAALVNDRFAEALGHFREGMSLNTDNAPLNADIQLVIDRIEALPPAQPPDASAEPAEEDASHVLLSNYLGRSVH